LDVDNLFWEVYYINSCIFHSIEFHYPLRCLCQRRR